MKILIACEKSGTVRDAFIKLGHEAISCDMQPSDSDFGPHYQGDVRDLLDYPFDMMIAHPPCTHIAVSGSRHFEKKIHDGRQHAAVSFFMMLAKCNIPRIAIENPVCIMSSVYRKPDQIIHPWQFGHMEQKTTCLWLKGLPLLNPTMDVKEEMMQLPRKERERIHFTPPRERSAQTSDPKHSRELLMLWLCSGVVMCARVSRKIYSEVQREPITFKAQ